MISFLRTILTLFLATALSFSVVYASATTPDKFFIVAPNITKLASPVANQAVSISKKGFTCDAALIRSQWAIASYCVHDDPSDLFAEYGRNQRVPITQVFIKEGVYLYHLSEPLIAPVETLPGSADPIPSQGNVTFLSQGIPWGVDRGNVLIHDTKTVYSETQPLRPVEYCLEHPNEHDYYPDRSNMLCTGTRDPNYTTSKPEFCWRYGGNGRLYSTIFGRSKLIGLADNRISTVTPFEYYSTCHAYPQSHLFLGTYRKWIDATILANSTGDREINAHNQLEPVATKQQLTVEAKRAPTTQIKGNDLYITVQPYTGRTEGSLTAIDIARLRRYVQQHFVKAKPSDGIVFLASETNFADALAASPLLDNRMLLLNNADSLEPEVLYELQTLQATDVVLLGGYKALGPKIEQQLDLAGLRTRRIAGVNREETAAFIHQEFARTHEITKDPWQIVLARAYGQQSAGFADSIALGAVAMRAKRPILLTGSTDVTPYLASEVQMAMRNSVFNTGDVGVTLIGGTGAIPTPIDLGIRSGFPHWTVNRLHGPNRFSTAVASSNLAGPPDGIILVDGVSEHAWQAGFAATSIAGDLNAAVYLLTENDIPVETKQALEQHVQSGNNKFPVVCLASAEACTKAYEVIKNATPS